MKLIDLSTEVDTEFWEPEMIKRKVINHKEGAKKLGKSYLYFEAKNPLTKLFSLLFKKKRYITYKEFPEKQGLSDMRYTLSTHTGTHIDAPFHYGKRVSNKPQRTISDLPLKYFYGNAVLIDFSNDMCLIDEENMIEKLKLINYTIEKNDIVLIHTGASQHAGTKQYFTDYKAIEKSAVKYLISKGVKVIGTDAFSFDPPFTDMIRNYKETKNKEKLWPSHFFGRETPYIQIERLNNLNKLPKPYGFQVCCFPIKLKEADAAWCRAVAVFE